MTESPIVVFLKARLDEDEEAARWSAEHMPAAHQTDPNSERFNPDRVLREVEADRKLIARYASAVESREESVQALAAIIAGPITAVGFGPASEQAARGVVAATQGRASALLSVLEDRAERFADHPDYSSAVTPAST